MPRPRTSPQPEVPGLAARRCVRPPTQRGAAAAASAPPAPPSAQDATWGAKVLEAVHAGTVTDGVLPECGVDWRWAAWGEGGRAVQRVTAGPPPTSNAPSRLPVGWRP